MLGEGPASNRAAGVLAVLGALLLGQHRYAEAEQACPAHHPRRTRVGGGDAQGQDAVPARSHLAVVGGGGVEGQPGPARLGDLVPLRRIQEDLLLWLAYLVEIDPLDPLHAPRLTWKQVRRYHGADRIREDDLVLYNPAKMRVERYRFRDSQISTSLQHRRGRPERCTLPADQPRRCRFVGQVSEHLTCPHRSHG
jgi:hypothetical protein